MFVILWIILDLCKNKYWGLKFTKKKTLLGVALKIRVCLTMECYNNIFIFLFNLEYEPYELNSYENTKAEMRKKYVMITIASS